MMETQQNIEDLYSWMLCRARKYCSNKYDAEDLAGETAYRVLKNIGRFDSTKPLKPWCDVIMLNTYISIYNRRKKITLYDYSYKEQSSISSSDAAMLKDTLNTIRHCARKYVSVQCVIDRAKGYTYDDISKQYDVPLNIIKSRIHHGRMILYKELTIVK